MTDTLHQFYFEEIVLSGDFIEISSEAQVPINIQPLSTTKLFLSILLWKGEMFEWTFDRKNVSYSCTRDHPDFPARIFGLASTFVSLYLFYSLLPIFPYFAYFSISSHPCRFFIHDSRNKDPEEGRTRKRGRTQKTLRGNY